MQTYASICNHTLICSFRGIHDCLVPVTPYLAPKLAGSFKHLRSKSKLPPRVRAMDIMYFWFFHFSWKDSSSRKLRSTTEEILWRGSSIYHLWWWKLPSCCCHDIKFQVYLVKFPGASWDSELGNGNGCRWGYVNSWAMTWSSRM